MDNNHTFVRILMFALGAMLVYISAAHLLPEAQEGEKKHSFISFFMGVSLALALLFIG